MRRAIFGATALAAVAAGGVLAATQLTGGSAEHHEANVTGATAPDGTRRTDADADATHETRRQKDETTATAQQPRTKEERIKAVREAAARHTTKINYPLAPPVSGRRVADSALTRKVTRNNGELLRLYSARQDLSGQKELAWITAEPDRAGALGCTNKVRFSSTTPAAERPTLLICWRISDHRSVYSVAVKPDGTPSRERSVAAVQKEWARLA